MVHALFPLSSSRRLRRALGLAALASLVIGGLPAMASDMTGDPARGAVLFNKCAACHRVGPQAKNGIGPSLNGLFGRQAGTTPGFKHAELDVKAGEAGLVWSQETLMDYLVDPNAYLKRYLENRGKADQASGNSRMVFKVPSEQERRDLLAHLKTFSN
jgi:cytochrome c